MVVLHACQIKSPLILLILDADVCVLYRNRERERERVERERESVQKWMSVFFSRKVWRVKTSSALFLRV